MNIIYENGDPISIKMLKPTNLIKTLDDDESSSISTEVEIDTSK